MRFFYSDPHFGHFNVINYANRPFLHKVKDCEIYFEDVLIKTCDSPKAAEEEAKKLSVKLMEDTLVTNWNNKVSDADEVYLIGDFAFATTEEVTRILLRLKGKKILILGNHDKSAKVMKECGFHDAVETLTLNIKGDEVVLNHYPYLDPELNHIAKLRPNIIKLNTTMDKLPPVPEEFNYDESKEVIKQHYNHPINLNLDPDKKVFNYFKKAISTHIGSRLINEGKILYHGHTHKEKRRFANMINFSVEAWDYTPVSEDEAYAEHLAFKKEIDESSVDETNYADPVYNYYASLRNKMFKPVLSIVDTFTELKAGRILRKVPQEYSSRWYEVNKDKRFIARDKLEAGKFYQGSCRNASWAYWNGKRFIYLRNKWGTEFAEEINCLEEDNGFDLFIPYTEYELTEEEKTKFYYLTSATLL